MKINFFATFFLFFLLSSGAYSSTPQDSQYRMVDLIRTAGTYRVTPIDRIRNIDQNHLYLAGNSEVASTFQDLKVNTRYTCNVQTMESFQRPRPSATVITSISDCEQRSRENIREFYPKEFWGL